ncbi:DUF4239 domain-containing protein [Candidatus Woesearchaeota archaeon]|nr:DUF4239 domain-containing protein [Candidatus Woesearchaeota archaeon]
MAFSTEVVTLMLTIIGILFGLIVSFYISGLWNRHVLMRELMAGHSAAMQNVVKYVDTFSHNERFKSKIRKFIEEYVISCISIDVVEQEKSTPYLYKIYDTLKMIQVKKETDSVILNRLSNSLEVVSATGQKIFIIGKESLGSAEWILISSLSIAIVVSTFLQRTTDPITMVLPTIFPPIILLIFFIIYDLDNLNLNEGVIFIEPDEQILDALGVERYYRSKDVNERRVDVKLLPKKYRIEKDLPHNLMEVYKTVTDSKYYNY